MTSSRRRGRNCGKEGIELHQLTTWWDVLKVARQTKYLPDATLDEVEKFLARPGRMVRRPWRRRRNSARRREPDAAPRLPSRRRDGAVRCAVSPRAAPNDAVLLRASAFPTTPDARRRPDQGGCRTKSISARMATANNACPSDRAATARRRPYLVPGDLVVLGAKRAISSASITTPARGAAAAGCPSSAIEPAPLANDPAGLDRRLEARRSRHRHRTMAKDGLKARAKRLLGRSIPTGSNAARSISANFPARWR